LPIRDNDASRGSEQRLPRCGLLSEDRPKRQGVALRATDALTVTERALVDAIAADEVAA
jgi:hypothetical protein